SNVVGNGAYTLTSWKRGSGWELAPNPTYYRKGLPRNAGVIFKIVADPQERLNLLKSGVLHVAFEVSAKDAAAIREGRFKNVKLVSAPSHWNFMLVFNNTLKPFDNKLVRHA